MRALIALLLSCVMVGVACGDGKESAESSASEASFTRAAGAVNQLRAAETATPSPADIPPKATFTFADAMHGWFAQGDTVLATSDGGTDWPLSAHVGGIVHDLHFISPQDGWAATDDGLFATRDGGASWQTAPGSLPGASFTRVDFVDALHGWLAVEAPDRKGLLITVDGGLTWAPGANPCFPSALDHVRRAGAFSFVSVEVGWTVCGGNPGAGMQAKELYKTVNGGRDWQRIAEGLIQPGRSPTPMHELFTGGTVHDLFMLGERNGWISGSVGITGTADGGDSWQPLWPDLKAGAQQFVASAVMITSHVGFLMTNPTYIGTRYIDVPALYRTEDGGHTWTQIRCGFLHSCSAP